MNYIYLVCQDVSNWLLNATYPDVITGKMQIVIDSSTVEEYALRLESQSLNEDKYYYNFSKSQVLSSPSDLLGLSFLYVEYLINLKKIESHNLVTFLSWTKV